MRPEDFDSLEDFLETVTGDRRSIARVPIVGSGVIDGRQVELLQCGHWFDPASEASWPGYPYLDASSRACRPCDKIRLLALPIGFRAAEFFFKKNDRLRR